MRTLSNLSVALVLVLAAAPLTARGDITISNHTSGSTLRYPVPLLRGTFTTPADSPRELTVTNESSPRPTRVLPGTVHGQQFVALTELVPGPNQLLLKSGVEETRLTLTYQPQTNPYVVRAVYMTDSTGDTLYQSQKPGDPQDYEQKLDTALKLMQTFTAERFADQGLERRTFALELDAEGRVKVHRLTGRQTAGDYYKLPDLTWYGTVQNELDQALPAPTAKNLVMPAYTRFDPATMKVKGHTALGGGHLALFGSGSLFSWPSRLSDVAAAFSDTTPVNRTQVHDDSAGRSVLWGLASTTMGAALHELGHTLDLPHTNEPQDVMTRGFDRFNRVFTLVEPPHAGNTQPVVFNSQDVATWAPISAFAMRPSRWLALDDRKWAAGSDQDGIEPVGDGWEVRAPQHGLRYIGIDNKDTNATRYFQFDQKPYPTTRYFSAAELQQLAGSSTARIRVVDDEGHAFSRGPLLSPALFVRQWQFTSTSHPWADHSAFVSLSAADRDGLQAEALATQQLAAADSFIDFTPRYPNNTFNRAGYAAVKFTLPAEFKGRLLTGSDDALRVWLDGRLVVEKLRLRSARIDEDQTPLTIPAGEHTFLVEVSQYSGGWGLYFRLEDGQGQPVLLRK